MVKLRDRHESDRPREKIQARGAAALSDLELLMAIIGSGTAHADVTKISRDLRVLISEKGSELTLEDLVKVKGMGAAKAATFMAGFELWRRQFEVTDRPTIDSPEKAVELLADIRDKKQEYFVCLTLDGANRLIAKRVITIGTLTSSLVHPREVFADAITDRAASIIVAHNHPSGSLKRSDADSDVTEKLVEASAILDINLKDHIIVTKYSYKCIL
jgi:DNA repair protein RadC